MDAIKTDVDGAATRPAASTSMNSPTNGLAWSAVGAPGSDPGAGDTRPGLAPRSAMDGEKYSQEAGSLVQFD